MRTPEPCLCGDPACPRCFPGGTTFEPSGAICDAVEALLDLALSRHHDRTSDETLTECHVCGQWEDHTPECFVPALQRWQNTTAPAAHKATREAWESAGDLAENTDETEERYRAEVSNG